jgi:uncharacterized membrane protein YeaQ/YmgE (transglycosylase-associated protein family)
MDILIWRVLGGWLLTGATGTATINDGNLSIGGMLISVAGAIALLALVRMVRGSAAS